ncbi:hypothetical protein BRADI_5g07356v3 [Brachypodium distachyon]|uniref:Uncharacterized protein n=1 Tax=Brachypodium distachyon TaxID=15368 RepID=A0A2K2CFS1_BRADI|nr:hypothetical protein BRADI_5g07356v3 [Brachypodium distachyon]PNT60878.1 hypothetical protein BRADI_5g07356v3 [Brachypodium distachyon]
MKEGCASATQARVRWSFWTLGPDGIRGPAIEHFRKLSLPVQHGQVTRRAPHRREKLLIARSVMGRRILADMWIVDGQMCLGSA